MPEAQTNTASIATALSPTARSGMSGIRLTPPMTNRANSIAASIEAIKTAHCSGVNFLLHEPA